MIAQIYCGHYGAPYNDLHSRFMAIDRRGTFIRSAINTGPQGPLSNINAAEIGFAHWLLEIPSGTRLESKGANYVVRGMSAVSILVRDDGINPLPDLFNPAIHHDEFSRSFFLQKDSHI